ncbi:DUF551 domain-containing protein [Salmonella enterica subsp. enterica serovar Virchow]|nr:DUF551 domain-containing protein [Salmonella enterica subsp. enterica serovar Virchow]EBS3950273.1 DUF551 domain-containing protein [Salmonella enterica subsp. enterica serovar Augustenborg]EHL2878770.1 DUF551 domain-containing protein [Salmonella enterica]EBS3263202.1 DUF551 domain-containing protein [Salmonella enterica subsp. enterica serovar Virchow]ECN7155170.1 DUF551 domain-containing protein [Salmonella enterica subsp. enterica serovar Virchow]
MTITKERLLKIQHWRETYGADSNVMLPAEEAEELARIALAALEAEKGADPVVFTDERNLRHIASGRETSLIWGKQNQEVGDIPLYRHAQPVPVDKEFIPKNLDKALGVVGVALPESKEEFNFQIERWIQRLIDRVIRYADEFKEQPVPVVPPAIEPDYEVIKSILPTANPDEYACTIAADMWNACRDAMLQGAEPVSQTYKLNELSGNSPVTPNGWISCSERMPNDKQYVWCWGKSYGWTECDTFEGYYDWSRNKWWAVTDDGEEPASKVTHWMTLPEPPQEVNRG